MTNRTFTLALWEKKVPYSLGDQPVDIPTIEVHVPEKPAGSAMVICPGGGYGGLANHEGPVVARWLNTLGITGVVLKYRLGPRYHHPAMLCDGLRAMRLTRHFAREWKIDPTKIGILGFSAGGHLASTVSTHFETTEIPTGDSIDQLSARPDVSVLLYPVITLNPPFAHMGSRRNLLGETPSQALVDSLCNDQCVSARTPPAFLFHTVEDPGVPIENALMYISALRAAKVPFEAHLYERGRHGVGLAETDSVLNTWPTLCANWLKTRAFFS